MTPFPFRFLPLLDWFIHFILVKFDIVSLPQHNSCTMGFTKAMQTKQAFLHCDEHSTALLGEWLPHPISLILSYSPSPPPHAFLFIPPDSSHELRFSRFQEGLLTHICILVHLLGILPALRGTSLHLYLILPLPFFPVSFRNNRLKWKTLAVCPTVTSPL